MIIGNNEVYEFVTINNIMTDYSLYAALIIKKIPMAKYSYLAIEKIKLNHTEFITQNKYKIYLSLLS